MVSVLYYIIRVSSGTTFAPSSRVLPKNYQPYSPRGIKCLASNRLVTNTLTKTKSKGPLGGNKLNASISG